MVEQGWRRHCRQCKALLGAGEGRSGRGDNKTRRAQACKTSEDRTGVSHLLAVGGCGGKPGPPGQGGRASLPNVILLWGHRFHQVPFKTPDVNPGSSQARPESRARRGSPGVSADSSHGESGGSRRVARKRLPRLQHLPIAAVGREQPVASDAARKPSAAPQLATPPRANRGEDRHEAPPRDESGPGSHAPIQAKPGPSAGGSPYSPAHFAPPRITGHPANCRIAAGWFVRSSALQRKMRHCFNNTVFVLLAAAVSFMMK